MLDVAYKNKVFEILVQVAKTLISVDDVETVLEKVMDLIFEYLPVDRGFLLLEEDDGLKLRISRLKSSSRMTTDGAPYSRTIVDMVVRQKVAVLTSDAQTDERFEAGMSIRMQQIRSAMCAPLWSRDSVIGVIHVDSPMHVGSFTEKDLDLLTALANFAAVAIERARLRERFEEERRIRGRLERYHSPQLSTRSSRIPRRPGPRGRPDQIGDRPLRRPRRIHGVVGTHGGGRDRDLLTRSSRSRRRRCFRRTARSTSSSATR